MTTTIDVEDVRNNQQDYLMAGEEIKEIVTFVYWQSRRGSDNSAHLEIAIRGGLITRKPKTDPAVDRLHHLKVWPEFFDALADGRKTFAVLQNDRDFQVGDGLLLREWNERTNEYTGRELRKIVTYRLRGFGVEAGSVCLSLGDAPHEAVPVMGARG